MKKWILLAALLSCGAVMLTGCGGGGSGTSAVVVSPFLGTYSGSYNVTSGPNVGQTNPFAFTVNSAGAITGQVTDANNNVANVTGSVASGSGAFTANGAFQNSTTVQVQGTITGANGTGTFAIGNGNAGTITFHKV